MSICGLSVLNNLASIPQDKREDTIRLTISPDVRPPNLLVKDIALLQGPADIYCWFEGTYCIPTEGASFLKKHIFEPLHDEKRDAKLYLYSLKDWTFQENISHMPSSTRMGEAINSINKASVECISSSSFFRYCANLHEKVALYAFLEKEMPNKKWLIDLSRDHTKKQKTVAELFNQCISPFDYIKDKDVSLAYSSMQYLEGYYLIQESIKKGLWNKQKKIQIGFVLPNDEKKYYEDYPKDIKRMLQLDFGNDLCDVDIDIFFHFFEYGSSLASRPYIDTRKNADRMRCQDFKNYFAYLNPVPSNTPLSSDTSSSSLFLRDKIHRLNA